MKVDYESMVDWRQWTDYLRCSPMFHGKPRYDCIIINTMDGLIMGQLVFMFTCEVSKTPYPLALIRPFEPPGSQPTIKDRELGFYRFRAKPRGSCEFFSVQSIVRGVLLVEDKTRYGEYLVLDSVDPDMFLCMKALRNLAL